MVNEPVSRIRSAMAPNVRIAYIDMPPPAAGLDDATPTLWEATPPYRRPTYDRYLIARLQWSNVARFSASCEDAFQNSERCCRLHRRCKKAMQEVTTEKCGTQRERRCELEGNKATKDEHQ
ncbi:uncharacterized protein LAESUDRAFT_727180 [Laetiporus sulphureus 93-53]|uniref:Uncharacterized protein n=1 Tax=Laetiporus sulphureus 93-53 TaxID=1314785 RepID=A0A165DMW6_9APHY|nr:uncharacterized protein LAESUDRAFT_727180 [Laetiporus sulphureus 93-53]KZT05231.1 hypothetical protein LAESUDRAFT_727180 [Laetiporus sulphureus 93-53]